jgi:hypothetical protein
MHFNQPPDSPLSEHEQRLWEGLELRLRSDPEFDTRIPDASDSAQIPWSVRLARIPWRAIRHGLFVASLTLTVTAGGASIIHGIQNNIDARLAAVSEAKSRALHNVAALQALGGCAAKLREKAARIQEGEYNNRDFPADPPASDFWEGAELAEANNVPCNSPANGSDYSTKIGTLTITIYPNNLTS